MQTPCNGYAVLKEDAAQLHDDGTPEHPAARRFIYVDSTPYMTGMQWEQRGKIHLPVWSIKTPKYNAVHVP